MTMIAAVIGVLVIPNPWSLTKGSSSLPDDLVTDVVKRGPFKVSVVEKGTVDSSRNVTLSSSVEGNTTIISIVPEGSKVKAGDIVCELDSSALRDKAKQQEINVTQALAALSKATEDLKIQENQNESDIAAAELAVELAGLDLTKYVEGELIQQTNELQGQLAIDKEELIRAEESYEFSKGTAKKGYLSQNDLEASRLKVQSAKLKVSSTDEKLRVLLKFSKVRQIAELKANAIEFERELERVKSKAKAALSQAKAEYESKRMTDEVEQDKAKRWKEQIAACQLKAPIDGEVVYANQDSGRRSGNNQKVIESGASVYERQAIIKLPDNTHMKVDTKIHESRISQVRIGLPVSVIIDAYPHISFEGVVEQIASVPMSGNWMNMDLKEYECVVTITDRDIKKVSMLRPGLTAKVEIMVSMRANILQAPVQSVVQVGETRYAYVATPDSKPQRRQLVIGETNDLGVEILEGLSEGEKLILNPRTRFAEEIQELESVLKNERSAEADAAAEQVVIPASNAAPGKEARPPRDGAKKEGSPSGEGDNLKSAAGPGSSPEAGPGQGNARRGPRTFADVDKNGDGTLSEDEVPERMRPLFSAIDANADGLIQQEEYTKAIEDIRNRFGGGRPADGGSGEGGEGGRRGRRGGGEKSGGDASP
ncbi:MAG: HlyD family efflux transporter periplasmic adaptor subunit [Planctomycetaceae bacterium]